MKRCDLDPDFSVAAMIGPSDLVDIADAGFRTIVCNLPDDEVEGQHAFSKIEAEAQKFGLQAIYLPVSNLIGAAEIEKKFADVMTDGPKPLFAYCKTGKRSAIMWARYRIRTRSEFDISSRAESFGYDVAPYLT